jgi:tetratricopeptide (TPR) repeat protein
VKNNEDTIEQTLDSIKNLSSKIIIGNLNSKDDSIKICKKYKTEIVDFKKIENISDIRNQLYDDKNWNMYIHPWEIFLSGHDALSFSDDINSCYVNILNNDIVSKEIRFWRGTKFTNPVFETIIENKSIKKNSIFFKCIKNIKEENYDLIKEWQNKNPLSHEPYYYLCFYHLSNRDYKNFITCADYYFAINNKNDISSIMLRYYLSQIQLYITKQIDKSAKNILMCLACCPTFAEFWCMMGDILYHQKSYEKAKCMYQNAIILGKRRSNNDLFPIEILKYKTYPSQMIENINKIKNYLF